MPPHPAIQLIQSDTDRFAAQGAVIATWRTYRGRRLGPYYRLTWRENHRQRSLYLGRDGPLVDQVRALLYDAQDARRRQRESRRRMQRLRRELIRPIFAYMKEVFRVFGNGLYFKGSEIRGFKTAGPRLTYADVPPHLIPKFPLPLPAPLAEIHNQLAGTDDFSAAPSPSPATSSENRQCCSQQEDPRNRPTSVDAPNQPTASPTSTPSLEIPQSVTQKPHNPTRERGKQTVSSNTPNTTPASPAANHASLRHSNFEFVSDFEFRISYFPEHQRTSAVSPHQPLPSPTSTPSLEIPQSVTQKPHNPTRERGNQTVSSNTPNTTPFLEIHRFVTQKRSRPTRAPPTSF